MKIYLAARYSRFPELQAYRDDLRTAGHVVTSRWIEGTHQAKDLTATIDEARTFAVDDIADLAEADCIISFTECPRSGNSRGGRHVEHGLALAWNKKIIVVGYRENVFHCLRVVEFFETWPAALAALDQP